MPPDDAILRARAFAADAHGDQRYGDEPYVYHLDAVAELASPYGETAHIVAYLHDVVEDTPVSLDTIRSIFGDLVACCVALVTDDPDATRAERKAKVNAKLAQVKGDETLALIVKAADRLANLRECVKEVAAGDRRMMDKYRAEHPAFRAAAYRNGLCEPLWQEIDAIVATGTTQS